MLNCSGLHPEAMTFLSKPSVKIDTNYNSETIFRIWKPFIHPANWLFRLIVWITVSKTGSFLSKSCRVCEKCQLRLCTYTYSSFADILTANPNNICRLKQSCSYYIGYALFPQTNVAYLLLHTSMTPCLGWSYLVPFDMFGPKVHTALFSFLIYFIQPPSQSLSLTVELKRDFLEPLALWFLLLLTSILSNIMYDQPTLQNATSSFLLKTSWFLVKFSFSVQFWA